MNNLSNKISTRGDSILNKKFLKVGIDLVFIKPQKMGGAEAFVQNLLKGFLKLSPKDMHFYLITARNNEEIFKNFEDQNPDLFTLIKTNVFSENVARRIIWENIFLDRLANNLNIDLMYVPIYSKPLFNHKLPYIITIHDLQALHYPEYFSKIKNTWLHFAWSNCLKTANKLVAISEFTKSDILNNFKLPESKISVINPPIFVSKEEIEDFNNLSSKYKIEKKNYLYTVSSMLPHKNLYVIIKLIKMIKENPKIKLPNKLVISGVGGKSQNELINIINNLEIKDNVVITGFVSDKERNTLYKNAFTFLFPSIFEGFGSPPVEALMFGTPVITTKLTSIPEATQNKAFYVDNPKDPNEWLNKLLLIKDDLKISDVDFSDYNFEFIANKYIVLFKETLNEISYYS